MTADLQAQLAEALGDHIVSKPRGYAYIVCECGTEFADYDDALTHQAEVLAALVSAHVAQVREGLADEIEAEAASPRHRGTLRRVGIVLAARIVRPSVGPREQPRTWTSKEWRR